MVFSEPWPMLPRWSSVESSKPISSLNAFSPYASFASGAMRQPPSATSVMDVIQWPEGSRSVTAWRCALTRSRMP
eukprot:3835605-Alexandrium_andersonii.AAC.1